MVYDLIGYQMFMYSAFSYYIISHTREKNGHITSSVVQFSAQKKGRSLVPLSLYTFCYLVITCCCSELGAHVAQ